MWSKNGIIFLVMAIVDEALSVGCRRNNSVVKCSDSNILSSKSANTNLGDLATVKYFECYDNFRLTVDIRQRVFEDFPNIEIIKITKTDARRLVAGTFYNSPTLRQLYLPDNNISIIEPEAFGFLIVLTHLYLNKNALKNFDPYAISLGDKIEYFDLGHNRFEYIRESSLWNLKSLTYLNLDGNKLKEIRMNKIINNPNPVRVLWLSNNLFTRITREFFSGLFNIEVLNLAFNKIDSIVDAFLDLSKLKTLILTHNNLARFTDFIIPYEGLNRLKYLAIDHNQIMYQDPYFLNRLPILEKITIMGNPWYCNCLRDFREVVKRHFVQEKCDSDYIDTERPICLSDHMSNNTCNVKYNSQAAHNFVNDDRKLELDTDIIFCLISEFS
ncbi:osteomodulin-like [Diabrotica undecimpunctata]|uniref:osteomodulin-like n=1 Tax=Diabrotica undecimpunctata TaxID=50387 RepID=UPI003B63E951